MFNFECGFTHVSHIWPDGEFHDESNGSCCKVIGVTTLSYMYQPFYKRFACFLTEKLFSRLVLASPFSITRYHFNPCYITSRMM